MRININVELDKETIEWVKGINKQLCKLSKQEIDFENMPLKPHLTLLLGEIEKENFAKIVNIVNDSRFRCELKTAEFSKPFIKNGYILMPIKNTEIFLRDCEKLQLLLSGMIVTGKHVMSERNVPHITLGYTKEMKKVRSFVENIVPPAPAELDQIVISRAGKLGVVYKG